MEPWQSWTAALVIGGAAVYYYTADASRTKQKVKARAASVAKQGQAVLPKRRTDDPSLVEDDAVAADNSSSKPATGKAKKRKASAKSPAATVATTTSAADKSPQNVHEEDGDDAEDNADWARQLQAAKEGVSLKPAAGPNKQAKGKKQKKPKEDTGIAPSPSLHANVAKAAAFAEQVSSSGHPPSRSDVSDMLEAPAPGPSILRVVGQEKPKKTHVSAPAPVQETKKQRQNRKKVEEKKLQREADETERQALLETQRRTAREARGEPAKNGLAPASAPTSSAWTSTNGTRIAATSPSPRPSETTLFDTFDHESNASSNEVPTNVTTPATNASTLEHDLPSEEVQLQMLSEINGNAGWNEVTKTKKGKKKDSNSPPNEPAEKETAKAIAKPTPASVNGKGKASTGLSKNAPNLNGFAALDTITKSENADKGHPDDSDWAVV